MILIFILTQKRLYYVWLHSSCSIVDFETGTGLRSVLKTYLPPLALMPYTPFHHIYAMQLLTHIKPYSSAFSIMTPGTDSLLNSRLY